MKKMTIIIALMVLIVGFLSGCNQQTSQEKTAPIINYFTATPETVNLGNNSVLDWSVTQATNVSINNKIGTVNLTGSHTVNITETQQIYILTAKNSYGTTNASVIIYGLIPTNQMDENTPNLQWTISDTAKTLTIKAGSPDHTYANTTTDGNLLFKKLATTYFVSADNLALTPAQSNLSTSPISTGDTITGFTTGTYQIIWKPTDDILGTIEFT